MLRLGHAAACRYRGRQLVNASRYGRDHRRLRAQVAVQVALGAVSCARCGLPIGRGEAWDLDHADDGYGYAGASHASCNRAAPMLKASATYADDVAAGVFWGPPDEHGVSRRWSRAWFDWRNSGEFR